MSLLWFEGFDEFNATSGLAGEYLTERGYLSNGVWGASSSVAETRFQSGRGWKFSTNCRWWKIVNDNPSEGIIGFAFNTVDDNIAPGGFLSFAYSDGTGPHIHCTVKFTDTVVTVQYNPDTSIGGLQDSVNTSPLAFYASTWNFVEVAFKIDPDAGYIRVRINGAPILSIIGVNTWNGSAGGTYPVYANTFEFGATGFASFLIDDVYLLDLTGTANNTYLGEVRVRTLTPNAVGSHTTWTPTGAATNWEAADNYDPTNTTIYNSSTTVGDYDLYNMDPLLSGATIFGLQIRGEYMHDDTGFYTVKNVMLTEGTLYAGHSMYTAPMSYVALADYYDLNPFTGVGWTQTEVNDMQIGPMIDNFGPGPVDPAPGGDPGGPGDGGGPGSPGGTPSPTWDLNSAYDFASRIGVNTHIEEYGSVYGDITLVKNCLDFVGITLCRDNPTLSTTSYNKIKTLGLEGIQFIAIPRPETSISSFVSQIGTLNTTDAPGCIFAVEGWNEMNGTWSSTQFHDNTIALWTAMKANPDTDTIPIASFTMAGIQTSLRTAIGDLDDYVDYGGLHIYANGGQPTLSFPGFEWYRWIDDARINFPTKPLGVTEGGFETCAGYDGTWGNIHTQATRNLNQIMVAWSNGAPYYFVYELIAKSIDPFCWGIFNLDGTPKESAVYLRNFLTILRNGAVSGMDGTIPFSLSGMPALGHSFCCKKDTNLYTIIAWAEPKVWSGNGGPEIVPPTLTALLTLTSDTATSFTVYDPALGTSSVATGSGTTQSFSIKDHPIFIDVVVV
jgi:hypothetical protein